MLWGWQPPGRDGRDRGLIAGGVLWSNVLGYHDASIAPVGPLEDLQHIGTLVGGHGPTFVNDFEVYGDRYFLRAGAPVEPAEFRAVFLPLSNGTVLTKSAAADLDSFALPTVAAYPSIVTPSWRRSRAGRRRFIASSGRAATTSCGSVRRSRPSRSSSTSVR